jgi:hypothetical protein
VSFTPRPSGAPLSCWALLTRGCRRTALVTAPPARASAWLLPRVGADDCVNPCDSAPVIASTRAVRRKNRR